jgi:hypothetical protein
MEIEADRAQLGSIVERLGGGSVLKETTGWLGARLARLKLGRDVARDLSTLEALEAVAQGVLGKRALWDALRTAATSNASLGGGSRPSRRARRSPVHGWKNDVWTPPGGLSDDDR